MADESTRKVQLGVEVDSTKARAGFDDVANSARKMAQDVESSGKKAGSGLDGIGKGGDQAAQRLDRSTKSIIAQIQRVTAEMQAGEKGSASYFESLARQRGANVDALKPYLAQLDAAKSKQDQSVQSLMNMGMSARQTAAALRTVPAQFTDIFTSLQAGQAPLTVLLQQGGQLKDQFGGVGAAAQALGRYVLGLINPFTVAAGALGALAFAAYQGSEEFREFQKTLILSGDRAGVTADQLMQIADSIDQVNEGITRARAAEVLNEIVRSGIRGEDQIRRLTETAVQFEKAGGGAAEEVAKAFKSLADDPLAASLKLNEAVGFLTESTYKQIKALSEQGRTTDAATVAINAYASALEDRIPKLQDNLGALQRAWAFVKSGAAEAWDAMLGIGRAQTTADRIGDIERRLRERQTSAPAFGETYAQREQETQRLRQELFQLRTEAARESLGAQYRGDAAQREKERIAFLAAGDKFLDSEAKKQKEIAQIQQLRVRNVITEAEARERIAKIEASYAKGGGSRSGGAGRSTENRELKEQADLLATLSGVNRDYVEQLARVQSMRESGLITEEQSIDLLNALIEKQPMARDLMRDQAEAAKALAQEQAALARAEQDRINAAERSAASVEDQVQKLLDEEKALAISAAANISLAQAIEEVNIARLREQQANLMAQGDRDAEVLAIQKEIEARRQLQQAIGRQEARKEAQEAADAAAKEWQKTADSIEQTLTDALMRGFEGGKSFGENFADSLVNTFKTYVAKEIASSLSKALLSSFSGQSGGFNLGSLFGGGQGGINWGDLAGKAFNYFTGGTSAAAAGSAYSLASGASSYGLTAGGTGFGVAAGGSGFGVTAGTAAAAGAGAAASGGAAGGASAGAMGAVPVVGWIAAAVMAADALYKRGYNREALRGVGESRDYKYSAENLARGLLDGLGFSEKWADILSGTVRMASLFGRRLKQEGYEVDIAGQNVDVEQYAYYKGGLFRSNKTVRGAADPDAVESLTFQVENVRESSKAMAQALGFSGDALDDFTGRMRINLKGAEDSAEAAKRYEEALIDLQRQMINSVTGLDYTKEEFAKFIEDINTSIQEAGISTSGIADIIVQGMLGELSRAQVGEQLANMVIGGIYNSIASPFASQIASVFTGQIIQPIFTAIAAGVPISQAISQQAIANVVQTAQQAAQQLNAIFADPSFRQAIAGVQQAISGIAGAATSVQAPAYKAAVSSYNAAAEAAKRAAEEIRRAWQGITDSILEEMRRIRGEIVGNTEAGYSYTYAEFVSETARARAGSRKAAERLPELSQAVIDLAANQATSLSDLNVIRGQILASLAETRKIIAKQQGIAIPKFDVGTNYVPRDMLAMVHEGEAIIPKKYNPSAGGSGDNQTVQQLSVLNAKVEKLTMILREIENDTSRLDRNFDLVSQGGTSVLTEAA